MTKIVSSLLLTVCIVSLVCIWMAALNAVVGDRWEWFERLTRGCIEWAVIVTVLLLVVAITVTGFRYYYGD